MKLTIDVENTVTKKDGKMHLDPFEPTNRLVMVGCLTDKGEKHLFRDTFEGVQELLDKATILIGHNIAYDLMWLWECGFKYDGAVFDTMLAEYVLQRGVKEPLSLEACAERYELDTKKQDTLKEYFAKGIGVDEIPKQELSSYLEADLKATQELADKLYYRLNTSADGHLLETVRLTNEVSVCLAKMYARGFSVDLTKLEEVRTEYNNEKETLQKELQGYVRKLMGDTPINLNSPEQLSWVIYGRKVLDKTYWANTIDPFMPDTDFRSLVDGGTKVLYKSKAEQCSDCRGSGQIRKIKKDGNPFANPSKCIKCNGVGYLFNNTDKVAGLRFKPPNAKWASANGFTTSKQNLEMLEKGARVKGMNEAVEFLSKVRRLSAVDTYLSSFIDGIETYTKKDGMLHVRLLQHRTATGRFSGADPNMQNMPRGGTFPVKKVFVSRWEGGKILEADFAQLEFRTAAYLSQDKIAMKEIEDGFDVHSYTASVISDAGQKTTRQEAKAHTFAPLYGATGFGRTNAEAQYYKMFTKKYKEIALWHSRLAQEAISTGKITTPSGRQFSFPDVERNVYGKVSHFTQIKNYPVQSFATADVVPVVLLEIEKRLQDAQSCIVNTVHDSIVIDVHPDEENLVVYTLKSINSSLRDIINAQFGINFNVPLQLDMKIGNNWLDTKDVV